jgi:hypothetical protein
VTARTAYTPVTGALPDTAGTATSTTDAEQSAARALHHPAHLDRNLLQQVIDGLRRL